MALSVLEVAKDMGVSKDTVYKEIREGSLKAFRVGKQKFRISEEELEAYKTRNTVEPMVVL